MQVIRELLEVAFWFNLNVLFVILIICFSFLALILFYRLDVLLQKKGKGTLKNGDRGLKVPPKNGENNEKTAKKNRTFGQQYSFENQVSDTKNDYWVDLKSASQTGSEYNQEQGMKQGLEKPIKKINSKLAGQRLDDTNMGVRLNYGSELYITEAEQGSLVIKRCDENGFCYVMPFKKEMTERNYEDTVLSRCFELSEEGKKLEVDCMSRVSDRSRPAVFWKSGTRYQLREKGKLCFENAQ